MDFAACPASFPGDWAAATEVEACAGADAAAALEALVDAGTALGPTFLLVGTGGGVLRVPLSTLLGAAAVPVSAV